MNNTLHLIALACFACVSFSLSMEDFELQRTLELQKHTWPLRHDLNKLKKITARSKCNLNNEQQEKLEWYNGTITSSLDEILKQCDHVRMNISQKKFSLIEAQLQTAQAQLAKARLELTEYKTIVGDTLKIDIETQQPKL
ncbi:hypothetical protein BH09DEP1_BH09DEP1_1590 [soil metagenome]